MLAQGQKGVSKVSLSEGHRQDKDQLHANQNNSTKKTTRQKKKTAASRFLAGKKKKAQQKRKRHIPGRGASWCSAGCASGGPPRACCPPPSRSRPAAPGALTRRTRDARETRRRIWDRSGSSNTPKLVLTRLRNLLPDKSEWFNTENPLVGKK